MTTVDQLHQLNLEELNFMDNLVHNGLAPLDLDTALSLEKKGFIEVAPNERGWVSLIKFFVEDGSEQLLMELRFERNEEAVNKTINYERHHRNG